MSHKYCTSTPICSSLSKLKFSSVLLELKISQLNEKLASAKKDYLNEADRNAMLKNTLKKIKIDLHNMTANFQDPMKLKSNVKVSFLIILRANY